MIRVRLRHIIEALAAAVAFSCALPTFASDGQPPSTYVHITNPCGTPDGTLADGVVLFTNIATAGSLMPTVHLHATNIGVTADTRMPDGYAHITNAAGGADDARPDDYLFADNPPGC